MAGFLVPCRSISIWRQGTLDSLLPECHLARFIWTVLSEIDFSAMEAGCRFVPGGSGRPPYHPRMLVALWIYAMTQGLETAAAIFEACSLRDDFRWLCGGLTPSDQTLLNLLSKGEEVSSIWVQVLQAMHREGHIDLSLILEDGTKLRANASQRSFHTAEEVEKRISELRVLLEKKFEEMSSGRELDANDRAAVKALQGRLMRAECAAEELRERASSSKRNSTPSPSGEISGAEIDRLFGPSDFVRKTDEDVLTCPAGETLRFIGRYPTDNGRETYRLYGRSNCTECPLKAQCTKGRRRRVKVIEKKDDASSTQESSCTPQGVHEDHKGNSDGQKKPAKHKPHASLTDPEAKLMLATSEKRWEPSFNADLAVTQDGVIVSQFLTKQTTDFHNFAPALESVVFTLDRPESWVGDGHYGTYENLQIAHEEGVVLYAPPAMKTKAPAQSLDAPDSDERADSRPPDTNDTPGVTAGQRFRPHDFHHDTERDILTCPAGHELRFIGEYPTGWGSSTYRLYGRRNCGACPLKGQCTTGAGRRVKIMSYPSTETVADTVQALTPDGGRTHLHNLAQELQTRMDEAGDEMQRIRRQTVEPTNAHLKQHGLGRFHVRGLARCATALTLACLAHNIMKWNARKNNNAMKLTA